MIPWLAILAILAIIYLFIWSLCRVAGRSDEEAERMFREWRDKEAQIRRFPQEREDD